MQRDSQCPFHRMLRHLKVFAGLPVPDSALWVDGKPDFRQIDVDKMKQHARFRLCAVCGKKLGFTAYWIGGERCAASHFFTDYAMHRECAEESMRLCPFLNGKRTEYRGDLPKLAEHDAEGRPKRMFLMRGSTAAIDVRLMHSGGAAHYAGDQLDIVKEF